MAVGNAKRDQNYVTTLIGVDMTTGIIPTPVYVDESTNRLLVSAVITAGGSTEPSYATKIDDTTTANMVYIGKAELTGAAISTAGAVWRVKRLDTSTLALDAKWADGNSNFDNIWDDRASLTYY